jgi:hypothetical protein
VLDPKTLLMIGCKIPHRSGIVANKFENDNKQKTPPEKSGVFK